MDLPVLQLSLMQTADFFRGDNPEGIEARNEVFLIAKLILNLIFLRKSNNKKVLFCTIILLLMLFLYKNL